ncbi:MAG: hypothetical protein K5884_10670 [Ruminococcus sp.]|nr:hypothetical protein [Ruminococcus sp.]
MKITAFNPLIVTKDAENVIKLFETLGFEKRHSLDANSGETDFTSVRMKNAEGFYVDVANVPVEKDMTLIRINVDDFDEAFSFFTARGFKTPENGKIVETKTNKSVMLISPSGFAFDLCQHIKD